MAEFFKKIKFLKILWNYKVTISIFDDCILSVKNWNLEPEKFLNKKNSIKKCAKNSELHLKFKKICYLQQKEGPVSLGPLFGWIEEWGWLSKVVPKEAN